MDKKTILSFIFLGLGFLASGQKETKLPPVSSIQDRPVYYDGTRQPDKRFKDGHLPHAVGVHSFQTFRVNRSYPVMPGEDGEGFTYNHQSYLAYWHGKFYLQFLSSKVDENVLPGRTSMQVSDDGMHWSRPEVIFPVYKLNEQEARLLNKPVGGTVIMHQRFGFYVAPNDVLLAVGNYGSVGGRGIGRAARRINKDGSYGPICFILYNSYDGMKPGITGYPYYKESRDQEFIAACDSLLANPLMRQQMWEEQRKLENFFPVSAQKQKDGSVLEPKAFSYFSRADGVVVGMWKFGGLAISADHGWTWTPMVKDTSRWTVNAKTWGQQLSDGKYALFYNHSATHWRGDSWQGNRFPLVSITSDDAHKFGDMLAVGGEVPPERYAGKIKEHGPQYVRGIAEGNGTPPGTGVWITYSMNKEDIWVSHIRVPIEGRVTDPVHQDFNKAGGLSDLGLWNFYVPQWAPVAIQKESGNETNHFLEMKDEDPYDYALAERIFPESRKVHISFRINPVSIPKGHGFYVNVMNEKQQRVLRLLFDNSNEPRLRFSLKDIRAKDKEIPVETGKWMNVQLILDVAKQSYSVEVDGKKLGDIGLAEKTATVNRLVFRTGPYRNFVDSKLLNGKAKDNNWDTEDLPGSETMVSPAVYWIDDVNIE